jgi:hypothetical protein
MVWLPYERESSEREACLQIENEKSIEVSDACHLFERKKCFFFVVFGRKIGSNVILYYILHWCVWLQSQLNVVKDVSAFYGFGLFRYRNIKVKGYLNAYMAKVTIAL